MTVAARERVCAQWWHRAQPQRTVGRSYVCPLDVPPAGPDASQPRAASSDAEGGESGLCIGGGWCEAIAPGSVKMKLAGTQPTRLVKAAEGPPHASETAVSVRYLAAREGADE